MEESSSSQEVPQAWTTSDAWMVWGFMAWLIGSMVFVMLLWHSLTHWNFLLAWLAAAFVALVCGLVDLLIYVDTSESEVNPHDAWKVMVSMQILFSLLGPASCLAYAWWLSSRLFRAAARRVAHIAARA